MATHYQGTIAEIRALDAYIKLVRASESVVGRIGQNLRAEDGLTLSQFGVLEALWHLGPLCQRDLGLKILKSSGNMTMVVDNLEKRQLVDRRKNADDRRVTEVHLTAKGRALIEDIFPRHAAQITEELGRLTAAEQKQLGALCRKLGLAN
ncbi:MAG TPA: MarR family transcriptional regulator [Candidatus Latescibacteria bacterium]|nr:MarR family transcriptional regulator [Candidatus Handelsmanbacteria bacterium]HIL08004.1 MarR family transcriptional regulator [Candidatus Latescibacterota bacterium]